MRDYVYKARDKSGRLVTGHIEADSEEAVATKVIKAGFVPLIIEEDTGLSIEEKLNLLFKIGQPTADDLIVFANQMYTMLDASVPLIKSLKVVNDSTRNDILRLAINDIMVALESGYNLSAAFAQHPETFPKIFSSLAVIGENTGHLDQSFEQISKYLETERETKRRIQSATRYPTFVFTAVFIALIIINLFVIPAFETFFAGMGAELPLMTKILLATSKFFQNNITLLIILSISLVALFFYWINTPEGDYLWSQYKLKFPIMGHIIHRSLVSRICRSFSLMLGSGVPVLQALVIVAKSTENSYMVEKVMMMRTGLERGDSLAEVAKQAGIFTPLVLQMIAIGEETGDMTRMLNKIAVQYEDDIDFELKRLAEVIEPIMISIVSIMVIILAMGIFLPMWEMSTAALNSG